MNVPKSQGNEPLPGARTFEKFIVIVTYGRSGSTLLQSFLQGIAGSLIRGENNNVLYPLFRAYKRAFNTRYDQGQTSIPEFGPWYGADEIVPRQFGERLASAFIDEILRAPPATRVLGFKEIRFHDTTPGEMPDFLDWILEYLRPCKIVFNTRDRDEVASSSWWKDWDTREVFQMVDALDREYAAYAARRPAQTFVVRYADYHRDAHTLQALFDFLGEPFPEAHIRAVLQRQLRH